MKHIAPIAVALFLMAGCAAQANRMMTWTPTGTPSIPQEQALAECRYDLAHDNRNFDKLFLMSGKPKISESGMLQGLNPGGTELFSLCMSTKGYRQAGWVSADK